MIKFSYGKPDTIPYAKIARSKKEAKKTRSASMFLILISFGPMSSNICRNCVNRIIYPMYETDTENKTNSFFCTRSQLVALKIIKQNFMASLRTTLTIRS